jgi:aminomethyltransferase
MVDFAGWEMPVQYTSIVEEHKATRAAAGLFDVSHMGEVEVSGPNALAFVQRLVTNDAARLGIGGALYSVMCREDGGIVDDLLVYRTGEQTYLLVINAANIDKDLAWMRQVNASMPGGEHADLADRSDEIALLALQGPRAFEIAQRLTGVPLAEIPYYNFVQDEPGRFFGSQFTLFSHTGYTGERGLELYVDAGAAPEVWDALMEAGQDAGLQPAGLGARDTLRLEAGYCLYGNDLDDHTNPLEAGLGWVVKLGKEADFIGKEALARIKAEGPSRKLVGFVMGERGIPRAGYELFGAEGAETDEAIGVVTSGSQSPVLGIGIGLGYVPNRPECTRQGAPLRLGVRKRRLAATVIKPPFFKR